MVRDAQWRTQKIFLGGVSFSGIWWSFVFGVRCLWRHNLTSHLCFQTNVLTKFVDALCIFFCTHSPYFVCHGTEYKLSSLQGGKTHSSLRQSKLQLQNQAARMSHRIRAVEHRCVAGLVGVHPGLQDRILLNYTRIENAHKARKKILLWCIEVQQTFSFLFPCWNIIKFVNTSMLTTAVLSSCNCSIMLQKLLM